MSWVKGELKFKSGKNINAVFESMEVIDEERHERGSEFGSDSLVLEEINVHPEGCSKPKSTLARMGAGCGTIITDPGSLQWTREQWMEKFVSKFGVDPRRASSVLVGLQRDLGAGGSWLCMDIAAGVAETTNIVVSAVKELVEIGLYRKGEGYLRYLMPAGYEQYQDVVNEAQAKDWGKLDPSFKPVHETRIEIIREQPDSINGIPCILASEPSSGSVEIIILTAITLPGDGWLIRDTEHAPNFALNRKPQIVVPRPGKSPLKLDFGSNGLDIFGNVIPLSGEAWQDTINEKTQAVLKALGWGKNK